MTDLFSILFYPVILFVVPSAIYYAAKINVLLLYSVVRVVNLDSRMKFESVLELRKRSPPSSWDSQFHSLVSIQQY